MSKPTFLPVPIRSDGTAFVVCELHRATQFGVMREEKRRVSGRSFTIRKLLPERYGNLYQSEGAARSMTLNAEGPIRRYVLGKRMASK